VPFSSVSDVRPAPRASTTASAEPPVAVASDRTAVAAIAPDQLSAPMPQSTPVRQGFELLPVSSAPSTRLRDAIAAARMPREPASSPRTRRDGPEPERRGLSRIAKYIGFDTTRPKVDVPAPEQRGRSWIAQHASFDAGRPK